MLSTTNIAYFISYIWCYFSPSAFSATPIVDLGYARYQGVPFLDPANNVTNTQFLAIRYGAAPTGTQRFRKPQLPLYTPGVQLANEQPSSCFQAWGGALRTIPLDVNSSVPDTASPTRRLESRSVDLSIHGPVPGGSEDCLFLNVHVPGALGEKKGLPVVVWIHGGGYFVANASMYNGNDLIHEAGGGVVAVVIQYRLGFFGFLAGEKVKEGGALNAGLLDQQAALHWVQEHISKFGGDPNKVTIWGESAGAGSVLQHVVANDGNTQPPLFRAAIASSTFFPPQYHYNDRIPELLYSEVVNQTGCSSARDTLECLRSVDVNALQSANVDIITSGFFGIFVSAPVVDGSFITERPTELLKAGKVNGGILLSVTNTFEGPLFVNQSTAATIQVADCVSQLFPTFTPQESNAVAAQYADLGTNLFQVNAILGESIFICPTYFLLRAFDGRAFKGEFAVPPAWHGQDIQYYLTELGNTNITTFGKSFSESFLNFVMTLDPNIKWDSSNITPPWGLWNGATEMLFNVTEAGAPDIHSVTTSSALLERCEFWQSVSALTAQ